MPNDVTKSLKNPARYIKKDELRDEGPRRLTIVGTVDGESKFSNDPELCLEFTDGSRVSLRADANLRACIRLFGNDADKWRGREGIEVYFRPRRAEPTRRRRGPGRHPAASTWHAGGAVAVRVGPRGRRR